MSLGLELGAVREGKVVSLSSLAELSDAQRDLVQRVVDFWVSFRASNPRAGTGEEMDSPALLASLGVIV